MGDKYRQKNPKSRKTKYRLVFDEESRLDFLTGFHRRKLDRQKFEQKKLEDRQKEEVREMRRNKKKAMEESFNLKITFPDEEVEKNLTRPPKVHDLLDHTVTVTSIVDVDLLAEHGGLGENKVEYDSDDGIEDKQEPAIDDFGFPATWNETPKVKTKSESPVLPLQKPETNNTKQKSNLKQRKAKRPRTSGPDTLHRKKKRKFSSKRKHHMRKR